jgi:hypothetical protein
MHDTGFISYEINLIFLSGVMSDRKISRLDRFRLILSLAISSVKRHMKLLNSISDANPVSYTMGVGPRNFSDIAVL